MRKKLCWSSLSRIGIFCLTLLAVTTLNAQETRRIKVSDWRDRMQAGWVGQMAGVAWGAPTEFKFNDVLVPEDKVPEWTPDMINHSFGQDDIYVEMTFLKTLEDYGFDCTWKQAGIDFANSQYDLWCANFAARNNLRTGIAPPDSGHPKFTTCPNDIDYQIEADFAGLIAPGMPNTVIALGDKFGRIMNYSDGLYGGIFMG
ncbi:MAG: ADP-ribosylglycohydrolase family protein, partial [Planctomycetia bacterium]|nr:ADP-ribosylglycohydrolase family protein [Planctomycetia bacterium]